MSVQFRGAGIAALAGLLFGLGTGCEPATGRAASAEPTLQLTILTPHDQVITNAFSYGFSRWYYNHNKNRVSVKIIKRGTPECLAYLSDLFNRNIEVGSGIPDLLFGGGIADHRWLAQKGYSRKTDLAKETAAIPAEVGGQPTRDPEGRWYATGLGTFGIYCNLAACRERGIEPPTSWSDLADPRFLGWIGLADPYRSGSTRECLLQVLQEQGWEHGWDTITRILANARGLCRSSAEALDGVETGIFLAACAVNFDAQRRAEHAKGQTLYRRSAGGAVSPDLISPLSTPTASPLAADFIRYVLSEEGQLIWAGDSSVSPIGGEPLYHYPIVPDLYEKHASQLVVKENPLRMNLAAPTDVDLAQRQRAVLLPLFSALEQAGHIRLQQVWREAASAGPKGLERWSRVVALPLDPDHLLEAGEAYDVATPEVRNEMLAKWISHFSSQLRAFGGGPGTS